MRVCGSVCALVCACAIQVATAAEETKNPGRDLPIGIVGSLSIATVFYVLMCLVITGMMPYDKIDINAPFSVAFREVGSPVCVHVCVCACIFPLQLVALCAAALQPSLRAVCFTDNAH